MLLHQVLHFTSGILLGLVIGIAIVFGNKVIHLEFSQIELSSFAVLFYAVGLLFAAITLMNTITRNTSKDYMEKSISQLEHAFELLNSSTDENGIPKNDRQLWLTSARLLKSGLLLGRKITESSHRAIFDEERRFWRANIAELLRVSGDSLPATYFAEKPIHAIVWVPGEDRAPISPKSIAVIYNFLLWGPDEKDYLAEEEELSDEKIQRMIKFGPHGWGQYLYNVRKIQKGEDNDNSFDEFIA